MGVMGVGGKLLESSSAIREDYALWTMDMDSLNIPCRLLILTAVTLHFSTIQSSIMKAQNKQFPLPMTATTLQIHCSAVNHHFRPVMT